MGERTMGAREDEPRRAPHAVPHQAPGLGFDFFTPHYRTSSRDHLHPTLLLSSSPLSMIEFTTTHAALHYYSEQSSRIPSKDS